MIVLDGVSKKLDSLYIVDPLLAILFLHEEHEEFLRTRPLETEGECLGQILNMIRVTTVSRRLSLQFLLNFSRDLYRSYHLTLEDVAIFLLCIGRALLLPPDEDSISVIRSLALSTRFPERKVTFLSSRLPLRQVVLQLATETSKTLMSISVSRVVFGRTNGRILSCTRAAGEYMPATGWLAPHVD